MNSSVVAGSYQMSSFMGLYIETRSSTSCSMSLSLETITTSTSDPAHFLASVPMTSSASKLGIRVSGYAGLPASGARRGSARRGQAGISVRFALYSAKASSRNVGPGALEDGGDVLGMVGGRSFRIMLWKMYTASVEIPVLVRMGGAPYGHEHDTPGR